MAISTRSLMRAAGVWVLACTVGRAAAEEPVLGAVAWRRLELGATKLLLSASTVLTVEEVPATRLGAELRALPEGTALTWPDTQVLALTMDTELPLGRHEVTTVWLHPSTGGVLQGIKVVTGRKPYEKCFRYTREGFYYWRASPFSPAEEKAGPGSWSKRRSRLVRAAPPLPAGAVATDSYALLYLVSAARLDRARSTLTTHILADERPVELRFQAGGLVQQPVDFMERTGPDSKRRRAEAILRVVTVEARPLGGGGGGADVDLGFLGLRGAVTVLVESGSGLPVQLRGRADTIGDLVVNLRAVEWAGGFSQGAPR